MNLYKKNNKGITLVSLVITIVIMLILATVSINLILGDNGLFNKAKTSAEMSNKENAKEELKLKVAEIQMDNTTEENDKSDLQKISDGLYNDDEVEYISLKNEYKDSKEQITVADSTSIYTKLKKYAYQFEINSSFEINIVDVVELKNVKYDEDLQSILTEARMNITLNDLLNAPNIMNQISEVNYDENENESIQIKQLLNNYSKDSISVSDIMSNNEFKLRVLPRLCPTTIANNNDLGGIEYINNLPKLNPVLNANMVYNRTENSNGIYYLDNQGGVIRVPYEYSPHYGWKALDNDSSTFAYSYPNALNFYVEYQFPQKMFVTKVNYIPTNGSSVAGQRHILIQGFSDNGVWENLTSGYLWSGSGNTPKNVITEQTNYTKSYYRIRLLMDGLGNSAGSGAAASGLWEFNIFGMKDQTK